MAFICVLKILEIYALLVVLIFGVRWIYVRIYQPQWDDEKRLRINILTLLVPAIACVMFWLCQVCISKDILVPSNQSDLSAHAFSIDVNNYLWKDYIIPLLSAILTGLFTFLGVMMTIRSSEKNIIENSQNQMEIVKKQTGENIKYKMWEQAYMQSTQIYCYFFQLQDECLNFQGGDKSALIKSCSQFHLYIEQAVNLPTEQRDKALQIYKKMKGIILSNPQNATDTQILALLGEYKALIEEYYKN